MSGGPPAGAGQAGAGAGDWSKVLDANRAGAAMDADAFTKEFMSQLTGQTAANLPPPVHMNGNGQQQQQQQLPQQQPQYETTARVLTPPNQQQQVTQPNVSPAARNAMNAKQYNSPQPLYSQVPTE